jgi:hypothetical protein
LSRSNTSWNHIMSVWLFQSTFISLFQLLHNTATAF